MEHLQVGTLAGMLESVMEVAVTCDGRSVVAAGADKAVRMWDIASGRVRHAMLGHSQKVRLSFGLLPSCCISLAL